MSQYSETIGSFIRTGNYPLEANYIFESEEALKQFYSDPVAATTLHEGLFKIVKTGANDKQALYWVVNGENGLEFKVVLEDLQLEDIETQIDNILQKIEGISQMLHCQHYMTFYVFSDCERRDSVTK